MRPLLLLLLVRLLHLLMLHLLVVHVLVLVLVLLLLVLLVVLVVLLVILVLLLVLLLVVLLHLRVLLVLLLIWILISCIRPRSGSAVSLIVATIATNIPIPTLRAKLQHQRIVLDSCCSMACHMLGYGCNRLRVCWQRTIVVTSDTVTVTSMRSQARAIALMRIGKLAPTSQLHHHLRARGLVYFNKTGPHHLPVLR
jgi:hypothetical protein